MSSYMERQMSDVISVCGHEVQGQPAAMVVAIPMCPGCNAVSLAGEGRGRLDAGGRGERRALVCTGVRARRCSCDVLHA